MSSDFDSNLSIKLLARRAISLEAFSLREDRGAIDQSANPRMPGGYAQSLPLNARAAKEGVHIAELAKR